MWEVRGDLKRAEGRVGNEMWKRRSVEWLGEMRITGGYEGSEGKRKRRARLGGEDRASL